jgi:hypothetical protein
LALRFEASDGGNWAPAFAGVTKINEPVDFLPADEPAS